MKLGSAFYKTTREEKPHQTLTLSISVQFAWRNLMKFLIIQKKPAVPWVVIAVGPGELNTPLWHGDYCELKAIKTQLTQDKHFYLSLNCLKEFRQTAYIRKRLLPETTLYIRKPYLHYPTFALPVFLWTAFLPTPLWSPTPLIPSSFCSAWCEPPLPDYQGVSRFYVWNLFFSC